MTCPVTICFSYAIFLQNPQGLPQPLLPLDYFYPR